jgi:hypothetical protein
VDRNPDGSVTVSIAKLEAISPANARLAALGIRARAVEVMPHCAATPRELRLVQKARAFALRRARHLALPPPSRGRLIPRLERGQVRFDPHEIPVGATLLLGTYRVGGRVRLAAPGWVRGAAPPCLAPAPLHAASKSGG